jgi:hypothetical protein
MSEPVPVGGHQYFDVATSITTHQIDLQFEA